MGWARPARGLALGRSPAKREAGEMTGKDTVDVLLIGESASGLSHLERRLEGQGCRCRFADSYEKAQELLDEQPAELVLSAVSPDAAAIGVLAEKLEGSGASFYYVQPAQENYWWIAALRLGKRCSEGPAYRPSEFAAALDGIVEEIRTGAEGDTLPVTASVIPLQARSRHANWDSDESELFDARSKAAI